jgi:hypothetical protein
MRVFYKGCVVGIALAVLVTAAAMAWLCFGTSGLPNVDRLSLYLRGNTSAIPDACVGPVMAVTSYEGIGKNMRAALSVAETPEDSPSFLAATYRGFIRRSCASQASLSSLISRTLICAPSRPLKRSLDELRMSIQLERRFSSKELFTILANRSVFADGVVGPEAAAEHFFGKHSCELSIDEAALLAGSIHSQMHFSPTRHPDAAIVRRNQVVDEMLRRGVISEADSLSAKSTAIHMVTE